MFAEFDLVMPGGLDEALDILAEAGGDGGAEVLPLAGGTNLVVDLCYAVADPRIRYG